MKIKALACMFYLCFAGSLRAEMCVENLTGLGYGNFRVAFTSTQEISGQHRLFEILQNGDTFCTSSTGVPMYLAIYLEPRISQPEAHQPGDTIYFSAKPFSAGANEDVDLSVELKNHRPHVFRFNGRNEAKLSVIKKTFLD